MMTTIITFGHKVKIGPIATPCCSAFIKKYLISNTRIIVTLRLYSYQGELLKLFYADFIIISIIFDASTLFKECILSAGRRIISPFLSSYRLSSIPIIKLPSML